MSYIDETYGKQLEEALRGLVSRPALGQPWFGFHESEVPAGVLLFTATTHSRVLYADFWNYIQNKNLVKTEEEWQSIYSEQGWCPFYSDGDGIDTFRMPSAPFTVTPETSKILFGIWAISAPQQPIPDATVEGIISELGVASNNALEASTRAEEAINSLSGVVRSINGVNADIAGNVSDVAASGGNYIRFTNGLQLVFRSVSIPSGSKSTTVTWPASFKESGLYTVSVTHHDAEGQVFVGAGSFTTTGCEIGAVSASGLFNWARSVGVIAIGLWK